MNRKLCYKIDENNRIALTRVEEMIRCPRCQRVLALVNDGVVFIKTSQTLFVPGEGYIFYCGQCKHLTRWTLDGKKLLTN